MVSRLHCYCCYRIASISIHQDGKQPLFSSLIFLSIYEHTWNFCKAMATRTILRSTSSSPSCTVMSLGKIGNSCHKVSLLLPSSMRWLPAKPSTVCAFMKVLSHKLLRSCICGVSVCVEEHDRIRVCMICTQCIHFRAIKQFHLVQLADRC